MFEVKTKGSKLTIELEANIKTKRQQVILKNLLKTDTVTALEYIKSFKDGGPHTYVRSVNRQRQYSKISHADELSKKEPNFYLKQFESMFETDVNHVPSNSDKGQWIGVEIECFIPKQSMNTRSRGSNCDCFCEEHATDAIDCCGCQNNCDNTDNYREALGVLLEQHKIKRCSVKSDASIDCPSDYFAVELTILFKNNDRENLKELCKVLNELKARVNASCGMHVHLDQRDLVSSSGEVNTKILRRRARNLTKSLGLFSLMVPGSRRHNRYCMLGSSALRGSRYYAVNLTAFSKYKTIEVRLHSATTDFDKISNWIDLLLMTSRHEKSLKPILTLSDLCMMFDVPEYLITYIESRITKFSNSEVETTNGEIASAA
jgi:hypothetical protein